MSQENTTDLTCPDCCGPIQHGMCRCLREEADRMKATLDAGWADRARLMAEGRYAETVCLTEPQIRALGRLSINGRVVPNWLIVLVCTAAGAALPQFVWSFAHHGR